MFSHNYSDNSYKLFLGKIKFAEINRAIQQAASQILKEQEALVEDEIARAIEPGGGPNDAMVSMHDATQRGEAKSNSDNLKNMGLEPALTLAQRCEWISALHDLQMTMKVPKTFKTLPNGTTVLDEWGYNPPEIADSIDFAIENMRQPRPSRADIEVEVEMAAEAGETLTPEAAMQRIMDHERTSFEKRKTRIESIKAEIKDLVTTLVTTSGDRDIMDVFMCELPENYRVNVAKQALRALESHRDQLAGAGDWKGVPKGKKAAGGNWMLYRDAADRLAEIKLIKPDITDLKGWIARNDTERAEFQTPPEPTAPLPTAKAETAELPDDSAAVLA